MQTKKEIQKERKRQKEERTSVPLYHGLFMLKAMSTHQ
jgi:hypothetical protein